MSLRHKSRRVFRFCVCSAIVLATFWATHEWERRATLREYAWARGVAAEQAAEEETVPWPGTESGEAVGARSAEPAAAFGRP